MAQFARPISDVSNGTWTPTSGINLYSMLDETGAADGNQISKSGVSTSPEGCTKLSSVTDPAVSSGYKIWFEGKDDLGTGTQTIYLLQGGDSSIGTLISTFTQALTSSFATYSYTLPGAEADAITNHGDLYLEYSASATKGNFIYMERAFLEVPNAGAAVAKIPFRQRIRFFRRRH